MRELLRNKSSSGRFIPGIIFRSIFFRAKKFLAEFFSGKKIPEFLMNIIPSQEYGFLRIARNVYSGVKFREEKFLSRSGSKISRNFIPGHLTPLRKINSSGIYVLGFLRNVYSCRFLVQEYIFLASLGI